MPETQVQDPFVSLVDRAMDAQNVPRFQQWRVKIRLSLPGTRREVENMMAVEMSILNGAGTTGLIDWENFDPDKFAKFVETLLKLIEAIAKLFA